MKSELIVKRAYFSKTWKAVYFCSIDAQASLSLLADDVIRKIIMPLMNEKNVPPTITDVKGTLGSGQNQLLVISGNYSSSTLPYSCLLTSDFVAYEGHHHIVFDVNEVRVNLPETLPISKIALVPGLVPTNLAAGFEIFRSRALIPILGFYPMAEESFELQASTKALTLKITSDRLPSRDCLPFRDTQIMQALENLFRDMYQISLIDDYKNQATLK